jgi:hypothetical protein
LEKTEAVCLMHMPTPNIDLQKVGLPGVLAMGIIKVKLNEVKVAFRTQFL